jgi:hypothetical protein
MASEARPEVSEGITFPVIPWRDEVANSESINTAGMTKKNYSAASAE